MKRNSCYPLPEIERVFNTPGALFKNTGGHVITWPAPELFLLPIGRAAYVFSYAGRVGDTPYYKYTNKYPITRNLGAAACKLPKKYKDVLAGVIDYVTR